MRYQYGGKCMDQFMNEDFLLNSDVAKKLYHNYIEDMPIVDYH